jgi:hypothetical protein
MHIAFQKNYLIFSDNDLFIKKPRECRVEIYNLIEEIFTLH